MENNESIQTFEIDLNIQYLSYAVQETLKKIGSCTGYNGVNNEQIVIEGKTKYGLQSIKLIIQVDKIDEANTKLTIEGDGDDAWGIGTQKSIERFISELSSLISDGSNKEQEVVNQTSASYNWSVIIVISLIALATIGYYTKDDKKTSTNKSKTIKTRYSCPMCAGPMPNDIGYIEYQGFVQTVPYKPGMPATCADCAFHRKQNYHKGHSDQ